MEYEYNVVTVSPISGDRLYEVLNKYAKDGWEFVHLVEALLILKRIKQN